jgi:oxygen-independent coproporphyrinogen-3 oxidase
MTTPDDCRSLYVHIPFCRRICGYCDFYRDVYDPDAAAQVVDALRTELRGAIAGRDIRFDTVFFGGGTPTVLPPHQLAALLGDIQPLLANGKEPLTYEFTVEANPATVTREVAAVLSEHGVNRVSVGAQSFQPGELAVLDRTHKPPQVAQTLRICREAGIQRLNVDLIFAIPGQTLKGWLANLEEAVALGTEHLSCYGLTYEPGTPMHRDLQGGRVRRVSEDVEAAMLEATIDMLSERGIEQYEISNYARWGAECRHNLCYWRNEPHLAIGPSAAGLYEGIRYRNVPDTRQYVAAIRAGRSPRIETERLPPERRARETGYLQLRLREGIRRKAFVVRFGCDPVELYAGAIEKHGSIGLVDVTEETVRLTRAGVLMADMVSVDFV